MASHYLSTLRRDAEFISESMTDGCLLPEEVKPPQPKTFPPPRFSWCDVLVLKSLKSASNMCTVSVAHQFYSTKVFAYMLTNKLLTCSNILFEQQRLVPGSSPMQVNLTPADVRVTCRSYDETLLFLETSFCI